ncbi:MAG TPA: hypothetical protein VFO65_05790 [Acidimicrobiales bacterium]|nr:hypothetical protein [Acidimicrobiales bacterium]
MPARVALACCTLWPEGSGDHAGLVEALDERGASADWVPWDGPPADWSAYDLVLVRETWNYPPRLADFLHWVDAVGASTRLVNPPAVVRWNHHKRYLLDLAAAGVPTVPTTVVAAGAPAPEAVHAAAGPGAVVVKPAVGIGGDGAIRGGPGDPAVIAHLRDLAAAGDVLVQPYLAGIETAGETSVVMFGGRVSHVVAKVPAPGEFRIHEHRGGSYARVEPTPAQLAVAHAAYEAARALTADDLLYARADLAPGDDGRPLLMELELIEPSLYLHTVPEATGFVADLVVARLAG